MSLDFNEIRQLLATIANTDIAELTLKSDDFEITVRKAVSFQQQEQSTSPIAASGMIVSGLPTVSATTADTVGDTGNGLDTDKVSNGSHQSSTANTTSSKLVDISSPMVGTFYRAPAPEEAPFVEVGDRVRSDQTVCIIEAMKLFNEIEAEITGKIVKVLVDDAPPVEYDQPLFLVAPS